MTEQFSQFSNICQLLRSQSGENEKILEATHAIETMKQIPFFVEYLIQLLVQTNDFFVQQFALVCIKNQVKEFWDNDQLYSNKPQIRNNLMTIMINSSEPILYTIAETISIISSTDFPERWPDLHHTLTSALNQASPQTIYAILYTASLILKKYEKCSSADFLTRELNQVVDYWGPVVLTLLTETLPQMQNDLMEKCFECTLEIIKSLCSQDLHEFFYQNLEKFFLCYHQFLNMEGGSKIKIIICQILKQHIIRYLTEIHNWGTKENNTKTDEEIEQMRQLWISLLSDLFNLTTPDDDSLVIAVFDALTSLARSVDRKFYTESGVLEKLCVHILIPCISLSDDDIYNFEADPLHYFIHDIEGLETESKRMSAYSFLKTIGRYFHTELAQVFTQIYQQLLQKYQNDPENSWKDMDTAIFIMGIIGAKLTLIHQGVSQVQQDFNLPEFLSNFIIPLLTNKTHLILQADAIKFIVDFRNVTDPNILLQIFPLIIQLLITDSPISFYSAYFIDRVLMCKHFEAGDFVFKNVDMVSIINRLFAIFHIGPDYNLIAARCLMRIVIKCGPDIAPHISGILSTCVRYLFELCRNPQDPAFNHCLFEIIVGAVTKVGIPVTQIEGQVIELLSLILNNDVTDFIPYVFQIIGCFMLSYPEGSVINEFYSQQFGFFLNPNQWMANGNVPALALLMQAYCIKLPQLIMDNIQQLFVICQGLLKGVRTHEQAFNIFLSIFRFIPREFTFQVLPQIYNLVIEPFRINEIPKKYRTSYAMFMSDACFYLGPDNALRYLPDLSSAVSIWAESLPSVRMRNPLERALSGCCCTLLQCTILSQEDWENLFVGTVKMLETPSPDNIQEEIEVIKIEEQEAKQFDTTFNKLLNAELPELKIHPELQGQNLVQYMATQLALYSQQHPRYLQDVIMRKLPPNLQNSFAHYEKEYNITFM